MQNRTLLPKRIIKKISLSAATLAIGVALWSNVSFEQKNSTPCLPGFPDWPECLKEKDGDVIKSAELQARIEEQK